MKKIGLVFLALALLAIGSVAISACGSKSTTTPSTSSTSTTVGISLVAQNMAFDKATITIPAGSFVTINFNNMDAGVPHNFALYTSSAATTSIFVGDKITGANTTSYHFTAPSTPGTYFFRCDVHPTTMTGSFIVT
jgi:plastocyanin